MITSNKNAEQEHLIVFIHVPKTAGMTVHWVIDQQYEPGAIFTIDSNDIGGSVQELFTLPELQKKKLKIVKGHIPFVACDSLPPTTRYFTILRDPIDRIISHYYFMRRNPQKPLYHEMTSRNMTLKDYVCSGITNELDNGQTKFLSNFPNLEFGRCSPEVLENAKESLKKMTVVGLTERFDETLLLLKRTFGWKTPFYFKHNVSPHRPRKKDISQDTLHAIKKLNEMDFELYRYAEKLLEQQLKPLPPSFKRELAIFKCLNMVYDKIHPFYLPVKFKLRSLTQHSK